MTANGHKVSFGGDEYILELVAMVAKFCEHTKTHGIVHLIEVNLCYMNFISIKLLF